MQYGIEYCENHYYHCYDRDEFYGGATICKMRNRLFDSRTEAEDFAKEKEWQWDKCKSWGNKKYQIVEVTDENRKDFVW